LCSAVSTIHFQAPYVIGEFVTCWSVPFVASRCTIDRSSDHVTNDVFMVTEFVKYKGRQRRPAAT